MTLPRYTVDRIFHQLAEERPEPRTELHFTNPYTLLVAVVLSAQATDVGVNKATNALFARVQSPNDMVALGEEALVEHIRTIGLFRTKARHVMALSQRLIDVYGGEVPADREALQTLPGVGRKTANVVLNCAFGQPTMAVDTHVHRVANRIGLSHSKTPEQTEAQLLACIPEHWMLHAHHWLILHGRYTCKARNPECHRCVVSGDCAYYQGTKKPAAKNSPRAD